MFNLINRLFSKSVDIRAPFNGYTVKIEDVPDEVFAKKMVGEGLAIMPESNMLLSPIDGRIMKIFPTKHAVGIISAEGIELLVHLGIDTVELKGEGFVLKIDEEREVTAGEVLMEIDWKTISEKVPSIVTPVIITNPDVISYIELTKSKYVKAGDTIMKAYIK